MKAQLEWDDTKYEVDFSKPLDISLPLKSGGKGVNCFHAPRYEIEPVKTDNFIGDTRKGGIVNFFNVKLNPHGNGTHTECVGHISKERISINASLQNFHYFARVVSILPTRLANGDLVINRAVDIHKFLKKALTSKDFG